MKMIFLMLADTHESFWIRADLINKMKEIPVTVGEKRFLGTELSTELGVFIVRQDVYDIADKINGIVEIDAGSQEEGMSEKEWQ